MEKKLIFSILFLAFAFLFGLNFVSASDCGGDVACSCGDTLTSSRILNSSDNLIECSSSSGILIYANDIILDCNDSSITGDSSGIGINIDETANVTIKNCRISEFYSGIVSLLVSNLTIQNTDITSSASEGIEMNNNLDNTSLINVNVSFSGQQGILFDSRDSTVSITNSRFYNNTDTGISLYNLNGVVSIDNTYSYSNEEGIYVYKANASIINSKAYGNRRNGIYLDSEGTIWANEERVDLLCVASIKNTSVYSNEASGITYGNYVVDINSSRIYNNTYNGINIGTDSESQNPQYKLRLTDSNVTNNGQDGIFARYITEDSLYNISNNKICGNLGAGAQVDSSCPFVFAWNGTEYQFINDAFPLGKLWFLEEVPWIVKILVKIGILSEVPGIRDTTYNKIPFQLEEVDGKYQLKVREQYDERSYFDSMNLMIVDHSPDYEVYPNRYGSNIMTTSKNIISPISCVDNYGEDCLPLIKEQDNNVKKLSKNDYVIINFGNLSYAEKIKMVISKGAVGAQNVKKFEVKDRNGNWVEADYELGEIVNLYGFPTTQNVFELTDLFKTSNFELKIFAEDLPFLNREFDERLMIDYIGIDTSQQRNDFKITTLKPVSATLSSVNLPGFWSETKVFEGVGYQLPQYYESPTIIDRDITADIKEDDCNMVNVKHCKTQVVMEFGDEITANYGIPALEDGMERDFIVITNGAYEKLPSSGHTDIFVLNGYSLSGSHNTCDTTWNYHDEGFSGCENSCGLTYFAGGSGSSENPYQIETCQQLQSVTYNLTANYILNNNINCSNTTSWNYNYIRNSPSSGYYRGFVPIGAGHLRTENNNVHFTGTFEGNNYNITNLYINSYYTSIDNYNYIGLFGVIGSGAVVRNLGLVDVNISGGYQYDTLGGTGGLAGYSTGDSTINNTFTTGNVSGASFVGGLVGAHDYDPGTCFAAGTKILLQDNSYKNIEDIKVGDAVESYNELTSEKLNSRVIKTFEHIADSYLIINNKLRVTPNHLMFVNEYWKEAGELKIGDDLLDENNNQIKVYSIVYINNPLRVYNFEVDSQVESEEYCGPGHSYYADGFLAHNKCPRVYTNNGTSYEFDSLLSVYHIGKHTDGIFNYSLKNFDGNIRVDYDPNEINYLDSIEIHVIDASLINKQNKIKILKPLLCTSNDNCNLSLLSNIDSQYLVLDENNREIFLNFGTIPEKEQGYNRTYLIVSKGYSEIIHPFKVSDFPDYIQKWLREYNNFLSQGKHHTIINSYSTCSVTGSDDYAGGLVGYNVGTINGSYATGIVNGGDYVGGFAGYSEAGEIHKSYSTGNVIGSNSLGGFIGVNYGFVESSYALGSVRTESAGSSVGGFVGYNGLSSFINNSYSRGDVSDRYISNYVGGFVGQNPGDIYTCYSTGDVSSEGSSIGGFAGINAGDSIYSSYATGSLTSENTETAGGFIGSSPNDYINCGWTTDSALVAIGYDSSVDGPVEFISYNESSVDVFFDTSHGVYTAGENGDIWDFTNVWSNAYDGRDYPILKWQSSGVSSLRVNIVSPSNNSASSSPVSFVFNAALSLDEQEIEYCNLTTDSMRTSEIESNESDLLALWHFNDNLVDSSGNGNDGTANDGEFNHTGSKFGSASYYLNGTQNIVLPDNAVFTSIGNFTLSAWVKLNSNDGYDSILAFGGNGDDFLFAINDRHVNFYTNSGIGSGSGGSILSLNKWYNVVAVRQNNIVSFYVNGVDDGSYAQSSADPITINNAFRAIGGDIQMGQSENIDGYLDEVVIWNRSLSASEVFALYSRQHKNSSTSIVKEQNNILSLNLSNGNYTWNIQCKDNTGLIKTTKTRSLTVTETVDEENQTENQTTTTTSSSYSPQTYFSDVNLPLSGNNFNLRYNDKIRFVVQSNNHTLTMQNFNSTTARVVIRSNPITAYLQKGTLYEFDLNNDSVNDVRARYDGMNKTKAMIFIQEIVKTDEKNINNNVSENNLIVSDDKTEDLKYFGWKIIFLVIAIVLIILLFAWKKFENKIKEYFWIKGIERSKHKNKPHQYYP